MSLIDEQSPVDIHDQSMTDAFIVKEKAQRKGYGAWANGIFSQIKRQADPSPEVSRRQKENCSKPSRNPTKLGKGMLVGNANMLM